jgi:undecaprenyl-diphosphatase
MRWADAPAGRLRLSQALVLGALHGPAELLPISSSGHITIVPWLCSWDYMKLEAEDRKAFEVALHAGTAAALLIALRGEIGETLRAASPRLAMLLVCSFLPPAVVGYGLERPIERHFGTPTTIAWALIGGGVVMALADRIPQQRGAGTATSLDALLLGVAQACALVPGISRNGATLAAARLRGFTRAEANRLSRQVALPVIAGAAVLKSMRLRRRGLPGPMRVAFAGGTGAAFASTLAFTWVISVLERDRSLLPYAAYRIMLGSFVLYRVARVSKWRTFA